MPYRLFTQLLDIIRAVVKNNDTAQEFNREDYK